MKSITKSNNLHNRRVAVLDFPSSYGFPPRGYGGIERWLWSVAKTSRDLGMRVDLIGRRWQANVFERTVRKSIENFSEDDWKELGSSYDFLVAGHEYWLDKRTRDRFSEIATTSITFQLNPGPAYQPNSFDRSFHHLFCYSDEMVDLHKSQNPHKLLCVGEGIDENPLWDSASGYLVWVGRLDSDKAPHLAIQAAKKVGKPVYIIGGPIREDAYFNDNKRLLSEDHVRRATSTGCSEGELTGPEKMALIAGADCALYTTSSSYVEAAGIVFGEYLRSGVPVAALSYRQTDSANASLGTSGYGGRVVDCNVNETEATIIEKFANAIVECCTINRQTVREFGKNRFDPEILVAELFTKAEERI